MKIKTQSFTLRIPVDLLEKITAQAGEGVTRSEFIIDILENALETGIDDSSSREMAEILLQLENFKTEAWDKFSSQEDANIKIHNRLETLELALSQQTLSSKTNRKTESNTSSEEKKTDLELLAIQVPVEAQEITEAKLIELLKTEEPSKQWSTKRILERRRKGKEGKPGSMDRIHSVGTYRFKYKEKGDCVESGKQEHIWYLLPKNL
jgi:hypothetical protein